MAAVQASPLFPTQVYLTGKGSVHHTVADLNGDGKKDLVVVNQMSNDLTVLLGVGDGTFAHGVQPSVGQSPTWVTAADLDQDGRNDLVVTNGGSGDISILLGVGDGSFEPEARTTVGSSPVAVLAGDFNLDEKQDLLTVNRDSDNVTVLLGRGDGTFDNLPGLSMGDAPVGATIADLNQDGQLDLAVAVAYSVKTYLGNGTGSFALSGTHNIDQPPLLRAADLDRDGRIDLLAATYGSIYDPDPYRMTVLRATGGGQFQTLTAVPVGGGVNALEIGDVDGDGRLDVVKESYTSRGRVLVFAGNGDGTFKLPRYSEGALFASSAGLDDFNGDAILDLVEVDSGHLRNNDFGRIAVMTGRGDGTFSSLVIYPVGHDVNLNLAANDLNADDIADIVVINDRFPYPWSATVLLGRGDGTLGPGTDYSLLNGGPMMMADFNTDAHVDLVVATPTGIVIFVNIGDGSFMNAGLLSSLGEPRDGEAADFNGDEFPDLVLIEWYPEQVSVFLGGGDGRFAGPISTPVGGVPDTVAVGDFNADGKADLAIQQRTVPSAVDILLGRGDGTFDQETRLPIPQFSSAVIAGDFNDDAWVDLAATWSSGNYQQAPGEIALFLSRGDGTFLDPLIAGIGSVPEAITTGDLNVDGHLDIATGNQGSDDVSILLGHGDGTFASEIRIGTGAVANPWDLTVGDLNRDRRPDLIVSLVDLGAAVILNTGPIPDTDQDGTADFVDDCTDSDGDGFSDRGVVRMTCALDNCPTEFNPGQADSNDDGAGDACQPTVTIEEIREDGGSALEVRVSVMDPQGEPLRGTIQVFDTASELFQLNDPGEELLYNCSSGRSPDGVGSGIAFGYLSYDEPLLFQLDHLLGCEDGRDDYELARGSCGTPAGSRFSTQPVFLAGTGQGSVVCVRRAGTVAPRWNWAVTSITPTSLTAQESIGSPLLFSPYVSNLPDMVPLSGLVDGRGYRLRLSAADANTPPVVAEDTFIYHGETVLVLIDDLDNDGIEDGHDVCIDPDHDGLGGPATPFTTCPLDNCPRVTNPGQEDRDLDGVGDLCDPCTDADGDGAGDPGFERNLCVLDNCPLVSNTSQLDSDTDEIGDACDACTDGDGDGYGVAGFPASVCPLDNCPEASNPGQEDADGDGIGDPCDPCTDTDGDGNGDPEFSDNLCLQDNCPATANASQSDLDGDGSGDACDTCTDADRDGYGAPGLPASICPLDNCPGANNPGQEDADRDGVGDRCDPCTDVDSDGWGDPGYPASTCPRDNCPTISNPLQENSDFDAFGDPCDPCPLDIHNDADHDGRCADRDNCPLLTNAGQEDVDDDRRGDVCDNCPGLANPDQRDADLDGLGNACDNCATIDICIINAIHWRPSSGGPLLCARRVPPESWRIAAAAHSRFSAPDYL